jgi:putative oxidoreductase
LLKLLVRSSKIVPESAQLSRATMPFPFLLKCRRIQNQFYEIVGQGNFMKSLNSLQPLGLLLLRLSLALIFFTHGYPKLAHSGAGMQGFFIQHGMPGYFVYVSGVLEVFGGILLALGLFTRGAALLLGIEMGVAIWKVHSGSGYLAVHDYEFPLAMLAGSFALATVGAGMLSLDYPLFESGKGRSWRASKAKI